MAKKTQAPPKALLNRLLSKKKAFEKQLTGLRKKVKKAISDDTVYERNSGDPDADFITESYEIEKDELLIHQLEKDLRDIELALAALDEGTYGVCRKCGSQIDAARLRVIPWAKYCYRCQSSIESG